MTGQAVCCATPGDTANMGHHPMGLLYLQGTAVVQAIVIWPVNWSRAQCILASFLSLDQSNLSKM